MAKTDRYPRILPVPAGSLEKIDAGLRVLAVDVLNPYPVMRVGYGNCLCWCDIMGHPYPERGIKDPPWKPGKQLTIREEGQGDRQITVVAINPKWTEAGENIPYTGRPAAHWFWEIDFTTLQFEPVSTITEEIPNDSH